MPTRVIRQRISSLNECAVFLLRPCLLFSCVQVWSEGSDAVSGRARGIRGSRSCGKGDEREIHVSLASWSTFCSFFSALCSRYEATATPLPFPSLLSRPTYAIYLQNLLIAMTDAQAVLLTGKAGGLSVITFLRSCCLAGRRK